MIKQEILERLNDYFVVYQTDDGYYLQHDFYEGADGYQADTSWEEYCYVQDKLREYKLQLVDYYIEYDCVSGYLDNL